MKPHSLFQFWTPDETAECLDGVGGTLYGALWDLVQHYEKRDPELRFECPPDPGFNCLADFWDKLSADHQDMLNDLAYKHEKQWERL